MKKCLSMFLAILLVTGLYPTDAWTRKAEAAVTLQNPRIVPDDSLTSGQKVTWDCVWFGSYPQSEVKSTDAVYSVLESASGWDGRNDIVVGNAKYRRMKKGDATYSGSGSEQYQWADSTSWHYFKYEPIKWRVLKVSGGQAFLRADIGLDDQEYNKTWTDVTWETSTIRSWLNGYGAGSNKDGINYSSKNFIGSAFSNAQRNVIANTNVVNEDNKYYGTEGGNATTDKIFLLSESEVYGTDEAASYGFVKDYSTYDNARRLKSSDYAKAMGTWSSTSNDYADNCWWWLRSPGYNSDRAARVNRYGHVDQNGASVNDDYDSVCPALNLNLSSSNQYTYAGTVSSDGTINEEGSRSDTSVEKPGSGNPNGNTTVKPAKILVSSIKIQSALSSNKIAAGKKVRLKAIVSPSKVSNKSVAWKSSNKKVATVNSKGIVTVKKGTGGKKVVITATAKDGSRVKASYRILSMKGVVKKVAISGKKAVKAGKALKLKAKVTASNPKKANKKLKWTSSNTKLATVNSAGKVNTKKAGKGKKVKITAMATDGSGKKASVIIKIK